jgi:hypothetical protein
VAAPIPPDIRRYLEGLLFLAGQTPGRTAYEAVLADLFAQLNRFTMVAYINSLSASSRAVFDHMVADQRGQLELEQFVHAHAPDLIQTHTEALRAFRRQYLRERAGPQRNAQTTNKG